MTNKILGQALTFDDVLLVPRFSSVLPNQTDTTTALTRDIHLNTPIISAAMDTVTEYEMAIAIAQLGGIGFIHKNMSIEAQADQVRHVKKFESGIIRDPVVVHEDKTVKELIQIQEDNNISGVPVVKSDGSLSGIVTRRDVRYVPSTDDPVSKYMTPRDRVIVVSDPVDIDFARSQLHKYKLEKMPIVNDKGVVVGLVTSNDLRGRRSFPDATKDAHDCLRVGAAIGVGDDVLLRAQALHQAGADVLVVDTAHGHSEKVLEVVKLIKKELPDVPLIAGNIATPEAAKCLIDLGVDGIKVGIGPGSICTTRVVTGIGVPQVTAILTIADVAKAAGVPIIADGGIRYSGDIVKAIACGADTVMLGSLFAGSQESPGNMEFHGGRSYKVYRGMGSLGAMAAGSKDRYFQDKEDNSKFIPEGIEGIVPFKGPLNTIVRQLVGGLRSGMGYLGCSTVKEVQDNAQFYQMTQAGVRESHVHDVTISREAPNYSVHK